MFKEIKRNDFELIILILLPFLCALYFMITLPVSYDEAFTYLHFTSKGFLNVVTNYEAPNNHVFFTILTYFSQKLPSNDILLKLRLPSFLILLVFIYYLYLFGKKFTSTKGMLILLGIVPILFLNIYYSYMARGYMLVNVCFVASAYSVFSILKGEKTNNHFLKWAIFSIIGFYVMPSYLYAHALLTIFFLLQDFKKLKEIIIFNSIVGFIVFLLYTPIFIVSGPGSVVNNPFVQSLPFLETLQTLPHFLKTTLSELFGFHYLFGLSLIAIIAFLCWKSTNKFLKVFGLLSLMLPILMLMIQSVIPFPRTFIYYGFILIFLLIELLNNSIEKINSTHLVLGILLLQFASLYNFQTKIKSYEDKDIALNTTSHKIIESIKGNKNYYINGSLLGTNLEFELKKEGFKNYKITREESHLMSSDTLFQYDYVIIDSNFDTTKTNKPLFSNPYFNVYKVNSDL